MGLLEARDLIDLIDNKMQGLFLERMEIVRKVKEFKLANNLPVEDITRENQMIQDRMEKLKDSNFKDEYLEFLNSILRISKNFQKK
jgi:chorismate mutase/prephenate dehydratase